jgi:hypothetical protein
MDTSIFLEVLGLAIALAAIAVAAMMSPLSITVGEVAGLAAVAVLGIDLYAYFIGWPSDRLSGALGLIAALALYVPVCFALHVHVFQRARRRLRPQFTIELLENNVYIFPHMHARYGLLNPLEREVWFHLRVRNEGAPGTITQWSQHSVFSPNAGFRMPDGRLLTPMILFVVISRLSPDGTLSLWTNRDVIPHVLDGWIGLIVTNAPTINMELADSEQNGFAGIKKITPSCCDHLGSWSSLTIPREVACQQSNNVLIDELFPRARLLL